MNRIDLAWMWLRLDIWNNIIAYRNMTIATNKATYSTNKLKRAFHALKVKERKLRK